MNIKSNQILLLFCISIFLAFGQQTCQGMVGKLRRAQEDIMRQAREQNSIEPEASREIRREILQETLEKIEEPTDRSALSLRPIKTQIEQILAKDQVSPEEIADVRENLDKVVHDYQISDSERSEYENLRKNIDRTYEFTKAIAELKESHASIVDKLNNNFEAVADDDEKVTFRFNASLIANIVMILGLVTRIGNIGTTKLDRQLKQLEIVEKKAKLKQDGIDPEKYL